MWQMKSYILLEQMRYLPNIGLPADIWSHNYDTESTFLLRIIDL